MHLSGTQYHLMPMGRFEIRISHYDSTGICRDWVETVLEYGVSGSLFYFIGMDDKLVYLPDRVIYRVVAKEVK